MSPFADECQRVGKPLGENPQNNMTSRYPSQHRIRTIIETVSLIALLAVIVFQQSQIRKLQGNSEPSGDRVVRTPSVRSESASGLLQDSSAPSPSSQPQADTFAQAKEERLERVENQLKEISAPLVEEMASTMFHADINKGQSLVTGGYSTADGKNQFTILKPSVLTDRTGGKQIQIDSNLIALSQDGTKQSGLDSLATNARNTLQHAESWDESEVNETMARLQNLTGTENLGQPKIIVTPGEKFAIQMTSDDQRSYTLSGIADLSPDGSGVVLKARIEQKEARKIP